MKLMENFSRELFLHAFYRSCVEKFGQMFGGNVTKKTFRSTFLFFQSYDGELERSEIQGYTPKAFFTLSKALQGR